MAEAQITRAVEQVVATVERDGDVVFVTVKEQRLTAAESKQLRAQLKIAERAIRYSPRSGGARGKPENLTINVDNRVVGGSRVGGLSYGAI